MSNETTKTRSLKVELHILQNFAPSNLNRDDTGTPKSCEFGGYRRARVSSQCIKRVTRTYVRDNGLLDEAAFGDRSKLFRDKMVKMLTDETLGEKKKNLKEAEHVSEYVFKNTGLYKEDAEDSGYLVFLGVTQIEAIRDECLMSWPAFESLIKNSAEVETKQSEIKAAKDEKKKLDRAIKKQSVPALESQAADVEKNILHLEEKLKESRLQVEEAEKCLGDVAKKLDAILCTKRAADIAMFGRMITTNPKYNIAAASQVAHAISTHSVPESEFDYFTALDELKKELKPDSDLGAAMIENTLFNSACYYRYANVDTKQLSENLADGESDLVKESLRAFFKGFVLSVPTGKQNGFASPTLPSLVLVVVRQGSFCSLANAFATPVRPRDEDDDGLIGHSIRRLDWHFGKLEAFYGKAVGTKQAIVWTDAEHCLDHLGKNEFTAGGSHKIAISSATSVDDLIERTINAVFPESPKEGAPSE